MHRLFFLLVLIIAFACEQKHSEQELNAVNNYDQILNSELELQRRKMRALITKEYKQYPYLEEYHKDRKIIILEWFNEVIDTYKNMFMAVDQLSTSKDQDKIRNIIHHFCESLSALKEYVPDLVESEEIIRIVNDSSIKLNMHETIYFLQKVVLVLFEQMPRSSVIGGETGSLFILKNSTVDNSLFLQSDIFETIYPYKLTANDTSLYSQLDLNLTEKTQESTVTDFVTVWYENGIEKDIEIKIVDKLDKIVYVISW